MDIASLAWVKRFFQRSRGSSVRSPDSGSRQVAQKLIEQREFQAFPFFSLDGSVHDDYHHRRGIGHARTRDVGPLVNRHEP
jgi:hypothetical protein